MGLKAKQSSTQPAKTAAEVFADYEPRLKSSIAGGDRESFKAAILELCDSLKEVDTSRDSKAVQIARLLYIHNTVVYDDKIKERVLKLVNEFSQFLGTAAEHVGGVTTQAGVIESVYVKHSADCVCMDSGPRGERVVLIKRKHNPGKGFWALPGGFVDSKDGGIELFEEAARREMIEETGFDPGSKLTKLGEWNTTKADIRAAYRDIKDQNGNILVPKDAIFTSKMHAFYRFFDSSLDLETFNAGDDASEVRIWDVRDIERFEREKPGSFLAFPSHQSMIVSTREKWRERETAAPSQDVELMSI